MGLAPDSTIAVVGASLAGLRAAETLRAEGHTGPLVVIGANSIFIYSIHQVLQGWLSRALGVFTFKFAWLGDFAPVAQSCAVLLVMWYLCYWLYQRKIFFKL